MHSVRRVKTTAEQKAAKKVREAAEIAKHQKLLALILKRSSLAEDPDALARTTDLLATYPEQYTCWNIRRELLGQLSKLDQQKYEAQLKMELKFTESLLPAHPKVYWIWNHRRWVLSQLPREQASEREIMLVSKMLERDPRNFHGWGYRWYVLQSLANATESTYQQEFEYTTKKINENFSNFSAWHYRAQLIPLLQKKPSLASELNYVFTAVSMDPADQSGWLYYHWLLESSLVFSEKTTEMLHTQLEQVNELHEEEPTIWGARTIYIISALLDLPHPDLTEQMLQLDPLRKTRYLSSTITE